MHRILSMPNGDKFFDWFRTSVVTDEYHNPLRLSYGSRTQQCIHPLMHFGTTDTENNRLHWTTENGEPDPDGLLERINHSDNQPHIEKLRYERRHPWGDYDNHHIYPLGAILVPVFLRICHPLVLDEDIFLSKFRIKGVGVVDATILHRIGYSRREIIDASENDAVAHRIADKGYDGVSYPNLTEGVGERSWIILEGCQAWPVLTGIPQIPVVARL